LNGKRAPAFGYTVFTGQGCLGAMAAKLLDEASDVAELEAVRCAVVELG